jgi:hypothetical protein
VNKETLKKAWRRSTTKNGQAAENLANASQGRITQAEAALKAAAALRAEAKKLDPNIEKELGE